MVSDSSMNIHKPKHKAALQVLHDTRTNKAPSQVSKLPNTFSHIQARTSSSPFSSGGGGESALSRVAFIDLLHCDDCHWGSCGCVSTILSFRFSALWSPSSLVSEGPFSPLLSSSLLYLCLAVSVFI